MVRACVRVCAPASLRWCPEDLKSNQRRGLGGLAACCGRGGEDAAGGGSAEGSKKLRDAASLEGFLRSGR